MPTPLSLAVRQARLLAVRDALDAGGAGGYLQLYSGVIPATPETALTTQVLLGSILLSAVSGAIDWVDVSGTIYARLTLTVPRTSLASATGTIAWARFCAHDGTPIVDRPCGVLADNQPVTLNSLSAFTGGELQLISCVILE